MDEGKLISNYIEFIYGVCDLEKDLKDLNRGGEAIAKHNTDEELLKVTGYHLSDKCLEDLREIWLTSSKDIYCYCCGSFFIADYRKGEANELNDIFGRCVERIMSDIVK